MLVHLGDNGTHLALTVDGYAAALARHKEMGIYFRELFLFS